MEVMTLEDVALDVLICHLHGDQSLPPTRGSQTSWYRPAGISDTFKTDCTQGGGAAHCWPAASTAPVQPQGWVGRTAFLQQLRPSAGVERHPTGPAGRSGSLPPPPPGLAPVRWPTQSTHFPTDRQTSAVFDHVWAVLVVRACFRVTKRGVFGDFCAVDI